MSFSRTALRSASRSVFASAVRVKAPLRNATHARYNSSAPPPPPKNNSLIYAAVGVALLGGGYYYYTTNAVKPTPAAIPKPFVPTYEDYKKVYSKIADTLEAGDYDDGSYGPVLIRLAWHASGTYDAKTNTGGSSGATMRFLPESGHGANNGLDVARKVLEPIHAEFPWISYGDLWTLGGVCAVQELGGPTIKWRPGRADAEASACTPDGRLPDGAKGSDHIRDIFYRMGFNDQEIVALVGAHALGRCHPDRSGFDGPWTFAPTYLTNDFYTLLLNDKWHWKKWNGPAQFEDDKTKSLMMLPADMALVKDKNFKKYVETYAKSQDAFFEDFSKAFGKLLELGVSFKPGQESWEFPTTS
ncbi:heme peroxidase [Lipomyces tetrasporus]|uniref:Peroxidase n=1 Tax=Lipomyces tetrasporus TaxID=54092 RepID=A0AAD7VSP0_9ASCO|nr:heme peroxidase [Lipomyces tetrasporus]KAJ8100538.1 heme peroxidase [Lipomyces tetrasporus]